MNNGRYGSDLVIFHRFASSQLFNRKRKRNNILTAKLVIRCDHCIHLCVILFKHFVNCIFLTVRNWSGTSLKNSAVKRSMPKKIWSVEIGSKHKTVKTKLKHIVIASQVLRRPRSYRNSVMNLRKESFYLPCSPFLTIVSDR